MTDRRLTRAHAVLDAEIQGLQALKTNLDEHFETLVDHCLQTFRGGGKIVLTGVGKSAHVGRKMAATLASTGSPAVFIHPVEAMHGDLGVLSSNDLLITLSYSGETDELLSLLPAAKRMGAPIVAITGNADSSLSGWSTLTVPMPVPREACPFNLAPTTSTTALMALGDALAIVLLEESGFRKDDYARLHPAGAIGRAITLRVRDIMRTAERFPCVTEDVPVRDALVSMTRARSGSVAVLDSRQHLAGIFTDGDFRRHITGDAALLERPIGSVMTRQPVTVEADAMAVEVLKILEQQHIDDVLVVDEERRPVGLVDVQDLPGFKLM